MKSRRACPIRAASRTGGFTLVELLVTITIIGIVAGLALGALHSARQTARETRAKSLITKLDQIIMRKYESYPTRRVPISTSGMHPAVAARVRLDAVRDLIRMELPERWNDVTDPPVVFSKWPGGVKSIQRPAVSQLYYQQYQSNAPSPKFGPAECLYMIVATATPGAMEQFSQRDIGDADGDGWPEFHDGWDRPIFFLRWAPGFTDSEIQVNDDDTNDDGIPDNHDPLDPRNLEKGAYRLIPLIYSGGRNKKPGLELVEDYHYTGDPYANLAIGSPDAANPDDHIGNIHNHRIEQR